MQHEPNIYKALMRKCRSRPLMWWFSCWEWHQRCSPNGFHAPTLSTSCDHLHLCSSQDDWGHEAAKQGRQGDTGARVQKDVASSGVFVDTGESGAGTPWKHAGSIKAALLMESGMQAWLLLSGALGWHSDAVCTCPYRDASNKFQSTAAKRNKQQINYIKRQESEKLMLSMP